MPDLDKISQVYILSTDRSGSTLLSSILNSHPNIIAANEEPFAYFLNKRYAKQNDFNDQVILDFVEDFYFYWENIFSSQFGTRDALLNSLLEGKPKNIEQAIKITYLNFFPKKNKESIKVIIDKQLKHHYFLNDLQKQFPKAKYIVLVRDPRDNIAIKLKRAKKIKSKQDVYSVSVNWNYTFNTIFNKLNQKNSTEILFIKYENLVTNPEIELKKICSFLYVSYNEQLLEFNEEINREYENFNEESKIIFDSILSSLSSKINTDKIGLWKNNLTEKEIEIIMTICNKTCLKFGYETSLVNKSNLFNKSYFRALLFLNKKIFFTKLYNSFILYKPFNFLKKFKKKPNIYLNNNS